jgi:hypothetical protein
MEMLHHPLLLGQLTSTNQIGLVEITKNVTFLISVTNATSIILYVTAPE